MIKTEKPHLTIKADSHPGAVGKKNEDRYRVTPYLFGPENRIPSVLAVLCDGIGGHRAGEVAAELGVTTITETIAKSDGKKPLESMEEAIRRANTAIYEASQSDQGRSGMGATCAVAWIIGDRLYTANLGDSRIYILRDGHIIQLTTDHTWVQEAFDAGLINHDEMENHPNTHVIRRYLGGKDAPEPDFRMWFFDEENATDARNNQGMRLKPGDILLLCSDGLTDLVEDDEIRGVIKNHSIDTAVDQLIGMANARGGHDNITVILMKTPAKGVFRKSRKRRLLMGCLLTLILFSAMLTAFFFGWRRWQARLDDMESQSMTETFMAPGETQESQSSATALPTAEATRIPATATKVEAQQPTITPWPTNTTAP